jgi:potassium-dependent mechanosensitive channel
MHKRLLRLALGIFFLVGWHLSPGQTHHPKKEPAKTHIEYSLDTVMQKIDDMYMTLNKINSFQQKHFDTANIRRQLVAIDSTLDLIRDNLTGNSVTEYKRILLDEFVLNDIHDQLEEWRNELFQYNNNLVKMNAETAAFSQDTVLRGIISDSMYRQMYLDELQELSRKWFAARKSTDTSLVRVNALQSAISKPWFQTLDLLTQVGIMKGQISGVLFSKEYPYIWEAQGDPAHYGALAASSFRSERGLVSYFWRQNWGYYVYALLIAGLFFWWTRRNYKQVNQQIAAPVTEATSAAKDDQGHTPQERAATGLRELHLHYVRPNPLLAALVIALNVLPFFNFDAPTSFTQFGQLLLLIVVSVLFWLEWPRRYWYSWLYIVLLYVLFVGTGAALVPKQGARLWLLFLSLGSIVLVWYSIRRILPFVPYPRLVRAARWLFLVLNVFTILCNVTGRLSLSKIFSTSAIFGLVQVILLAVFVQCALEGLSLQTLSTKLRDKTNTRLLLFDKMQKGTRRLLTAIALLTWVVAFTINMNIYDPLYAMAVRFWDHTVKFGSISFQVGNVLLFILILYVSNSVQKYIGFLYGDGAGENGKQTGRKGSRLVMIRLILIIAGFLVAIAASGLPVDRITIVLGALGVGIGLGLQNIVNNLVSGIILIFEHPFQIGDYIELNGKKGVVRDIGIRSSRMITEEGTEIIMPNGDLLSGEVINWTVRNSQVRIEVPMTVEAGHAFDEISGIVVGALKDYPGLSKEDTPRVLLTTSTAANMTFAVLVYVDNIGQIQTIKSEVLRLLIQKLAEKGIKTV